MTTIATFIIEGGLCLLLAATLVYCMVLERRLKAVRLGQQEMNATIGDLNASLATAGPTNDRSKPAQCATTVRPAQ